MSERSSEKLPVAPVLKSLGVGESAEWPIERVNTVRQTACTLSLTEGLVFSCNVDRSHRTIIAKREG